MNFSETIFLFILALLVFGPKKLPEIARQVGKALNEFKRASNEFKAQIEAEISQLEVQERQEKWKREQEQKILPPAEPPAGVVETSTFSPHPEASTAEALPDPAAPQADMNSPAQHTTNA
jgi:sec-independent protein translocase protein TatB